MLTSCDPPRSEGDGQAQEPPPPPLPPGKAIALSSGRDHTCALLERGRVVCWGGNNAGQLGDGTTESRSRPVVFEGVKVAKSIHAGHGSTCVEGGDGLLCAGALNLGGLEAPSKRPRAIEPLKGAERILGARLHGCALKGGTVLCWGSNHFGQLGDGTGRHCGDREDTRRSIPAPVKGLTSAKSVAIGDTGSCVVLQDSTVRCWGMAGLNEQDGSRPRCEPVVLPTLKKVQQVVVGAHHGCALVEKGEVFCWGANAIGQLGILGEGAEPLGPGAGPAKRRLPPTKVTGINDAEQLAAFGSAHTCARKVTGQVACWGRNVDGQLGDGSKASRYAPVLVNEISAATDISAGYDHSCAIQKGAVYCWGKNHRGQLGDGTNKQSSVPVKVAFDWRH